MSKFDHIAVLGMGAFGVALTRSIAQKAHAVTWWGRDAQVCQSIEKTRHHPSRLPHVSLPAHVAVTTDIKSAVRQARCVILAVPMEALSSVLQQAQEHFQDEVFIVSTAKGIDATTLALPYDVVRKTLPSSLAHRACYLSGPSFAIELAMDLPTALTIASFDPSAAIFVQNGMSSSSCRLYRTDDVVGVCLGGAFKNVIAIAAGACTGLGLGKNALAALITRGLAEMTRLARALLGKTSTLSGLSGVGDLILSCTDDMSRNHRLGTLLADGYNLDAALATIGSVVEGAKTAKAIPALEKIYRIELPISHAVYDVLYGGVDARRAISSLLNRSLKEEDQ